MKTLFLHTGIALVLFSCGNQPTEKPVSGPTSHAAQTTTIAFDTLGYSADISAGMKPTNGLNNDAFMQYVDSSANEFIVGIAEPKKETQFILEAAEIWNDRTSFMENYKELTQSQLRETMTISSTPAWTKQQINGLEIESALFRAKHPTVPGELIYTAIYMEDETNIYIIYHWSMAAREKKYLESVSRFMHSIRRENPAS